MPARLHEAFKLLTEQYALTVSSENLPRGEFHPDILQRAYETRTDWIKNGLAPMSDLEMLEATSAGPDYDAAMPHMPELLQDALGRLNPKGRK